MKLIIIFVIVEVILEVVDSAGNQTGANQKAGKTINCYDCDYCPNMPSDVKTCSTSVGCFWSQVTAPPNANDIEDYFISNSELEKETTARSCMDSRASDDARLTDYEICLEGLKILKYKFCRTCFNELCNDGVNEIGTRSAACGQQHVQLIFVIGVVITTRIFNKFL